jgi:hypothetical protein
MSQSNDPRFEPTEIGGGERVAWVTQGIVVHIESDLGAVWNDVLRVFDALLQRPWAGTLRAYRRWDEPVWRTWDATVRSWVEGDLKRSGAQRRYFKLSLADEAHCPSTGFEWQDIPATHDAAYPRASSVLVRLPMQTAPDELVAVMKLLCEALPVQQGHGGYLCHVSEESRGAGFDQAWSWARRYYGLHVVDTVQTTWDAPHGIWGSNWLTAVGTRWLQQPLASLTSTKLAAPVSAIQTQHALILRAGDRPTLGDQNQFDDLSAYTLACRALEPALIAEPSPLAGMFDDHDSTLLWIRRFLEPTPWQRAF